MRKLLKLLNICQPLGLGIFAVGLLSVYLTVTPVTVLANQNQSACKDLLQSDESMLKELAKLHMQIASAQSGENSPVIIVLKSKYQELLKAAKHMNIDLSQLDKYIKSEQGNLGKQREVEIKRHKKAKDSETAFLPYIEKKRINISEELGKPFRQDFKFVDHLKEQKKLIFAYSSIAAGVERTELAIYSLEKLEFIKKKTVEAFATDFQLSSDKKHLYFNSTGSSRTEAKLIKLSVDMLDVVGEIDVTKKSKAFAVSPDDKLVVLGKEDGSISVYDLDTGEHLHTSKQVTDADIIKVQYSPDGSRIVAFASQGDVAVWDAQNYFVQYKTEAHYGHFGHTHKIIDSRFSKDGEHFYTASYDGQVLKFHLTDPAKHQQLVDAKYRIDSMDVSEDESHIAVQLLNGKVLAYNLLGSRLTEVTDPHVRTISSFAIKITPDSKSVLGLEDDKKFTVRDLKTGEIQFNFKVKQRMSLGFILYLEDKNGTIILGHSNDFSIWEHAQSEEGAQ